MILALSAIAGFLAVTFGAFGAHALSGQLSDEAIGWWDTATLYLLIHAGLATALSAVDRQRFGAACAAMLTGSVVFAATLYAMALGAPRWFGAITPIGGLGMLTGWALTAWAARKT